MIVVLVVWAGLSRARLGDWHDDQTLWASAVHVAPTTRALTNYASALLERGHWLEAVPWMITLSAGSDPKGIVLAEGLTHRAEWLGYPVCLAPALARWCAP